MQLHLQKATAEDLAPLLEMVAEYHCFERLETTAAARHQAISTLLANPTFGGIWLIVVENQPQGYFALTFGFSIEFGGRDAFIDELYIKPDVRDQGLGTQALTLIGPIAKNLGIQALHLEVAHHNDRAQNLYMKAGFSARSNYLLMSARLNQTVSN